MGLGQFQELRVNEIAAPLVLDLHDHRPIVTATPDRDARER
jgi:hypothetical protein